MKGIQIKNSKTIPIKDGAFSRLAKKYIKNSTKGFPVVISFDKRIKNYWGEYVFDGEKHLIKISGNEMTTEKAIKTLLHEIKHLKQWNKIGERLFSAKKYDGDDCKTERDAIKYEKQNFKKALKHYQLFCCQ